MDFKHHSRIYLSRVLFNMNEFSNFRFLNFSFKSYPISDSSRYNENDFQVLFFHFPHSVVVVHQISYEISFLPVNYVSYVILSWYFLSQSIDSDYRLHFNHEKWYIIPSYTQSNISVSINLDEKDVKFQNVRSLAKKCSVSPIKLLSAYTMSRNFAAASEIFSFEREKFNYVLWFVLH